MRIKYQLTRNRVHLQNRLEALRKKQQHIKLSSLVSDLLGASPQRVLVAVAKGETTDLIAANMRHHSQAFCK